MGRYSGDDSDTRCNRNWGHDPAHGDFWDPRFESEAYGHPAYVEPECRVPRWGLPLPQMNEAGEEIAPKRPPEMVDAFVPTRPSHLTLSIDGHQTLATEQDIASIMSNPFLEAAQSRQKVEKKVQQLHKKRMGSAGEVGRASDLPKWTKGEEKISTGIVQLDWALNGGIAPGTKWKSWGKNMTWKSTLIAKLAGRLQDYYDQKIEKNFELLAKRYGFDASPTILDQMIEGQALAGLFAEDVDTSWVSKNGLDPTRVQTFDMEYMEQSLDHLTENLKEDLARIDTNFDPDLESWMRAVNFRAVIIDSWDAMKNWSDDHGSRDKKAILNDNSKIGARAQILSQFWRQYARSGRVPTTMLSIAQQRTNIGAGMAYGHGSKGNADRHNTRLEVRHKTSKPNNREQEIELEFYQTQLPGGTNVGERESITIIGSLQEGIREDVNLLYAATECGVVKKSSWLTYVPVDGSEDDKISQQGTSFSDYAALLKEHESSLEGCETLYDEVYQQTLEQYNG